MLADSILPSVERDRMKNGNPHIDRGTVLAIPLGNEQWALSQVIQPGTSFYLGIAPEPVNDPISASDIDGKYLRLFSWTNDAEVYRGNWKNLGRFRMQPHPPIPEYKVNLSGTPSVVSFRGEKIRDFDPSKDKDLQFHKTRSPLLVQDAVQAACGFRPWKSFYNDLKL